PENLGAGKLIRKIVFESIGILVFASITSSIGGIGIELIERKIIFFLPLLIVIPALNDMIGDFGTITASNFTTLLYMGRINAKNWNKNFELRKLFIRIVLTSFLSALYLGVGAYLLAMAKGFEFDLSLFLKVLFTTVSITAALVFIIFLLSVIGGFYVYKQNHDPDNYLIPLTTAIADVVSMLVLAFMVSWLF
ncbi:MAG: magnesium transporter, partial [Candidatus Woesearchaeota archaeon]